MSGGGGRGPRSRAASPDRGPTVNTVCPGHTGNGSTCRTFWTFPTLLLKEAPPALLGSGLGGSWDGSHLGLPRPCLESPWSHREA